MPILIDVFNATHALGFSGSKVSSVNQLIELITSFVSNKKVHLFIDGFPFSIETPKNVHLHFSNEQTADDLIVAFIKRKKRTHLELYTNDTELKKRLVNTDNTIAFKSIGTLKQSSSNSVKKSSTSPKKDSSLKKDNQIEEQWFND